MKKKISSDSTQNFEFVTKNLGPHTQFLLIYSLFLLFFRKFSKKIPYVKKLAGRTRKNDRKSF